MNDRKDWLAVGAFFGFGLLVSVLRDGGAMWSFAQPLQDLSINALVFFGAAAAVTWVLGKPLMPLLIGATLLMIVVSYALLIVLVGDRYTPVDYLGENWPLLLLSLASVALGVVTGQKVIAASGNAKP